MGTPDADFEVTVPMQAPDRNCEVLQKSERQHASCKPRFFINALWLLFKRRRGRALLGKLEIQPMLPQDAAIVDIQFHQTRRQKSG